MAKEILGRDLEKKRLTETLYSHRSELVAVYGRRRIGKTYLIREFFKEKIIFSFIVCVMRLLNPLTLRMIFLTIYEAAEPQITTIKSVRVVQ